MVNKKITIILVVLVLVASAGLVYFDRVVLQKKVKTLIIEGVERTTGKRCTVRSINFNILKGVVIRDLIISDNNIAIFNSKEVYCSFLVLPLFKKELIISSLRFKSPEIFVERRGDNSLNIIDLVAKNKIEETRAKLLVRRINLRGGSINFRDSTLSPPLTKKIKGLNADIYLFVPANVRFKFECGLQNDPSVKINGNGEYDIVKKEFKTELDLKDLSAEGWGPYYSKLNFSILEGTCDVTIDMIFKDGVIDAGLNGQTKGLVFSKDKITGKIESDIKAKIKYTAADGQYVYSGNIASHSLTLSGIEAVDNIDDVKGNFNFNNSGISSNDITAEILGLPVRGKFTLTDFSSPAVKVEIGSNMDLITLQDILKDTFNIAIPADLVGQGKLYCAVEYNLPETTPPHVGGFLDLKDAKMIINKDRPAVENISGKFNFTSNQLTWTDLTFKYIDTHYSTSGILTNFDTPGVQMKLSSENLSLESVFGINGKIITFSKLRGNYFDSAFSLEGNLDMSDKTALAASISGTADIDLNKMREPLKKFKKKLDKIKPFGVMHAEFSLSGNALDIKSCDIEAKLSSSSLSFYDFKSSSVFMNYRQKRGVAEIPFIRANFYGGTVDANAKIELAVKDVPYSVNVDIKDVKLEQLKLDTAFKDKDISGVIYLKAKAVGYSNDASRLAGSGRITITNGKLWQLNLFRGLGVLLFTSDFSNVIFREGNCDFTVKDNAISTDYLMLKSDLLNFYGPMTIDSQHNIKADLKVELQKEALRAGTRKNITTTIGKYSLIEIAGTLKEPKYNLKPDVDGIIGDIADRIFSQ